MYTLRLSRRLLAAFAPADEPVPPVATTALGDWHVRDAMIGTRHLAVCASDRCDLAVVFPLPAPPALPQHLAAALVPVLRDLGVSTGAIAAELDEMVDGQIGLAQDAGMRALLTARVARITPIIAATPAGRVDARQLHATLAALHVRHAAETCGARARRLLENRGHA